MSTDNSHDDEIEREIFRRILYIRGQIHEGKTNDQIISDLVAKGIAYEQAKYHVETTREGLEEFMRKQRERIEATPAPAARVDEGQPYGTMAEFAKRVIAAQRGWRRMWIGLLVLILGSCITWGSYSSAASSPFGGSYTICYGAIIFGAILFLSGLVEWSSNR